MYVSMKLECMLDSFYIVFSISKLKVVLFTFGHTSMLV